MLEILSTSYVQVMITQLNGFLSISGVIHMYWLKYQNFINVWYWQNWCVLMKSVFGLIFVLIIKHCKKSNLILAKLFCKR